MKEIGDAEKHPEHDCDRGILHTAFSFMIFIIGQQGDRTREKICGECYAMHDVMLLLKGDRLMVSLSPYCIMRRTGKSFEKHK